MGEAAAAIPISRRRWRAALVEATGVVALLGLIAASLVIAVDAAAAPSFLVPAGRHAFPGWLAGPLHPLHLGSLDDVARPRRRTDRDERLLARRARVPGRDPRPPR